MMSKKSPQLRFEGFTDDWEERKLGEVSKYSNGGSYENDVVENGTYELITLKSVNMSGKLVSSGKFINRETKTLEKDTLVMILSEQAPGLLGMTAKIPENNRYVLNQRVAEIKPNTNIDSYFLSMSINRSQAYFSKRGAGTKVQNISKPNVENFEFYCPSEREQQKIGSFFKHLDETIALHQRKLDLLKEQKKGYLQKMFPKNGAKVPELRFAGFADDWEDRKLSSIAERVTRKNKNNESTLPLTISAQDGLVDQNDYFNKQVASRDVTGYFLVKNGEFAYNKSYSNGYPWGAIKRLDKYEMGVLSTLYIVFKPTAINSQFLVSYYETTRWYREVSKNAAEGARNHGLLNISPNDFFNTLLTIPKSAEEQQQIGSFFKQLDDTIALHQRKLDLLKEQKKGFLQKMFV